MFSTCLRNALNDDADVNFMSEQEAYDREIIMGQYFSIQSKLSGNVIDIQQASTKAGASLDAYPPRASDNDNQLWEFVPDPAGSGFYFIKSKLSGNVIDIQEASTKPGALLDAYTQRSTQNENQLWQFIADPAGSGYCFIASKLSGNVIDIQGGSHSAGALLDAYPRHYSGYDNQLWTVVGGSFPSVVEINPVPSGGYAGAGNYILASGSKCGTLTNVKATIVFTEDLVWQSTANGKPVGLSIQLNAETNSNQKLDWLQFMIHMGDDKGLWPWINIWNDASNYNAPMLWNQQVANAVANSSKTACIPQGYSIVIALQNTGDNVTGATWTVLDATNKEIGTAFYALSTANGGGVPTGDLCPIASFQVTIGGAMDGADATFSSGAGVIIYQADQLLSAGTSYPSCIGYQNGTGETSNVSYAALPANSSTLFSQPFKVASDSSQLQRAKQPHAKARTNTPPLAN